MKIELCYYVEVFDVVALTMSENVVRDYSSGNIYQSSINYKNIDPIMFVGYYENN